MALEKSQDAPGIVLVTGGTDGLGRAAAILLAERGYRVFAGGRNAERRDALAQLAREKNYHSKCSIWMSAMTPP